MSQFAILRTKKLKSRQKLIRAIRHNAYPEHRKGFTTGKGGVEIISGEKNAYDDFNKRIKDAGVGKIRQDAVLAIEFMATYSPEMKDKVNIDEWKEDTLKFFEDKYGKGRILQAVVHTDESTPHMHVLVMPIVRKQHKKGIKTTLSARDLIGGTKGPEKLTKLQTEYAEAMNKHGLERGVEGSRAKHKTLRQYIRELNHAQQKAQGIQTEKFTVNNIPKQAKQRLFGMESTNWKKAFEGLQMTAREIRKKYNGAMKLVENLTVKNKHLEKLLEDATRRNHELEEMLFDNGINKQNEELQQVNAQLQGEMQAMQFEISQEMKEKDEILQQKANVIRWWEQGYHGKDPDKMNPLMRQRLEEAHERKQRHDDIKPD